MQTIQIILQWLDGKKSYIVAFLALTCAFLGTKQIIDQDTQSYIQAILALIAGGTEYATVKLGARK